MEFSYERVNFTGSSLAMTSPSAETYTLGIDYFPMSFSGGGTASAPVTAVDINLVGERASTSGCEAGDFVGFPTGNIALIQRGGCNFSVKADNAIAVGASAVIIFNQRNVVPGDDRLSLFGGTLDPPVRSIPVVSTSFAQGEAWANTPDLELSITLQIVIEQVVTENLLAVRSLVDRLGRGRQRLDTRPLDLDGDLGSEGDDDRKEKQDQQDQ